MSPTSLAVDLDLFPGGEATSRITVRLSLEKASGIVGLCGPSGSGKSTLIRTLAGLDRRAKGRITVDTIPWLDSERGVDLPLEQRKVAYLPQGACLFSHMDVRGNLLFAASLGEEESGPRNPVASFRNLGRIGFLRRASLSANVSRLVDLFGIGNLLDRKVGELSGGQAMKVALTRCFLKSSRLYLLDEPLTGIDPDGRDRLVRVIAALLREKDAMAVWVTHAPKEIVSLAEVLLSLPEGGTLGIRRREECVPPLSGSIIEELTGETR